MKIKLTILDKSFTATLNETATAKSIFEHLPIRSTLNVWGNEIYFITQTKIKPEPGAITTLSIGDLAFYPPMQAFCIFFGSTPLSQNNQPEAAGPVTIFGAIENIDLNLLKSIKDGEQVLVEQV